MRLRNQCILKRTEHSEQLQYLLDEQPHIMGDYDSLPIQPTPLSRTYPYLSYLSDVYKDDIRILSPIEEEYLYINRQILSP